MPSKLYIDYETRSAVDLTTAGVYRYAQHPTTSIVCLGWAFDDEQVTVTPSHELPARVRSHVAAGELVVAHNVAFELNIWNELCVPRYGWPELKPEQCNCTMARAYAMALPGSLEKSSAAMGITAKKDMAGHRRMLQLSQPRNQEDCVCKGACICIEGKTYRWWTKEEFPERYEEVYRYCAQDVEVERALDKRLVQLPDFEREIWLLDQKINRRGVHVDMASAVTALRMVNMEKTRMDEEMRAVTQGHVATCQASAQLKSWLGFRGIIAEGVAKNVVVQLLARTDLPADCRRALQLRQEAAKSSTAKLQAMVDGTSADQRLRGMFQYHGASTGRFTGRRVQLHNLPRPKLSQKQIDELFKVLGAIK